MRIHKAGLSKPSSSASAGPLLGLLVLALGIAIGLLWPLVWERMTQVEPPASDRPAEEIVLRIPVARGADAASLGDLELRTIGVELDQAASEHLQRVVDRSLQRNQIVQEEGDLVPALIRADGKRIQAMLRIKGDFVDHVDTPKWSLRIELKDDKLFGMSRFSIQHPKTRSFLWEWLFMQIARREGILTPRSEFVNVVMNGNPMGIYYLEEHFTKELLESQGRREGPIVRFVEDAQLGSEAQYFQSLGYLGSSVAPVLEIDGAEIVAYGEKRLAQSEGLARQLQQAIELMRRIQADHEGQETHNLVDLRSSARYAALQVLFRCSHASLWKSRRYYHDPVSARLEPIAFDTGAGFPGLERDPHGILKFALPSYLKNPFFYQAWYLELGRMMQPEFLDDAWEALGAEAQQLERLLRTEGMDSPLLDAALIAAELRDQQSYLQEFTHPDKSVGFECRLLTDDPNGSRPRGDLQVEAWALTHVPVVFEGLVLGGGVFVPAERLHVSPALLPAATGRGLLLPLDQSRATFTMRNDERESILQDVKDLRKALASGEERDRSLRSTVLARTRLIHDEVGAEAALNLRMFGKDWSSEGGRPAPPTLQEALDQHGFLRLESEQGGLELQPGKHRVLGDLVMPEGMQLSAGPGVELEFEEGRGLISSGALRFRGSSAQPVRLGPAAGQSSWGGVLVIKADSPSLFEHVEVQKTTSMTRAGWMATGGVNFYRSPVDFVACLFEDALGEDALNLFGIDFTMRDVRMSRVASDAFDGDFVKGEIIACHFEDSVEDAVDVSGSQISVRGCSFLRIGDKAISVGEKSEVLIEDCVVESASIGVASKDSSKVEVRGLDVRQATNYAFAVYIKKPEFGPSQITASAVSLGHMGRAEALVQEGCRLLLNGRNLPTEVVDVKQLYRDKILGQ